MARRVPGISGSDDKWYATAYDPTLRRKVRVKNPKTGIGRFFSQAEAIKAKEHFELTKGNGTPRVWTVEAWVTEWTTNPAYARKSSTTNAHNAERVKKLADDFKDTPLEAVDPKRARDWAFKNKQRVPAVRTMFNDARKDGLIATNPFAELGIDRSKGRKNITPLTEDEVKRLAEIAYDLFPHWPILGAMILTGAYTGMRIGEMSGLKWDDIDWEAGTIRVERQLRRDRQFAGTKNGEARTIVMLEPVPVVLRDLPRLNDEGLVFFAPRGGRYYSSIHTYHWSSVRSTFYASLPKDRQEKIGPSLDFHELRHFCGSYLADRGVSAMDIAFQLGHTDGGRLAQELYVHVYENRALDRIRGSQLPVHRVSSGQT